MKAGARFFRLSAPRFSSRCRTISPRRRRSELCGREDQLKVSYSLSESGHDTKVSWLTGKALSHKANIIASKSYNTQSDYRFDMKTFMELRNAQSVILAYDGINPSPADVLLPEALLQRPERFVLRAARHKENSDERI